MYVYILFDILVMHLQITKEPDYDNLEEMAQFIGRQ